MDKNQNIKLSENEKKLFKKLSGEVKQLKNKDPKELEEKAEKMAREGIKNGSLNAETLENFKNKLAPKLNEEQLRKLNDFIKKVKK